MCQGCVSNIFGSLSGMRPGLSRRSSLRLPRALRRLRRRQRTPRPRTAPISSSVAARSSRWSATAAPSKRSRSRTARSQRSARPTPSWVSSPARPTIVDLDGRALLPGFIDAHQHTVTGALINAIFTDCGYTKYKTRDALIAMFRDTAAKTPAGQWLLFTSFDNLLQGGDLLLADLDAVSNRSSDPRLLHQHAHGGGQQRRIGRGEYSLRHRRSSGRRTLRSRRVGQAEWHGLRGDRPEEIRRGHPEDHARSSPAKRSSTG